MRTRFSLSHGVALAGLLASPAATATAAQSVPAPQGNVLVFDADPFVVEDAHLVAGFAAGEWSSQPVGLPGSLRATIERFDILRGLSSPSVQAFAPIPAGGSFALANQVSADIAVFNYSGSAFTLLMDANGNGLDDRWEARFGLHDPNGDADGDGFTNKQEHDAGTDPLDPGSKPSGGGEAPILRVEVLNAGPDGALALVFRWPASATGVVLERSDALGLGWQQEPPALIVENGLRVFRVEPGRDIAARFWRLRKQ
ncbi:MAG: hypothetical protein HYR88_02435 [Verrucomicrobia bacterium]|nr:hypothetical protein [Verrucomicrobiota bacterium]MBI3871367.1 hypothetical protein [Verrucomicrobiota bacterium]